MPPLTFTQITLIEPGRFRTPATEKGMLAPPLAAYSNPTTPAAKVWQGFAAARDPSVKIGDVNKAVAKIYEISQLPEPPLRVVFGKDCIRLARAQLELVKRDVDASEAWSEDLQED